MHSLVVAVSASSLCQAISAVHISLNFQDAFGMFSHTTHFSVTISVSPYSVSAFVILSLQELIFGFLFSNSSFFLVFLVYEILCQQLNFVATLSITWLIKKYFGSLSKLMLGSFDQHLLFFIYNQRHLVKTTNPNILRWVVTEFLNFRYFLLFVISLLLSLYVAFQLYPVSRICPLKRNNFL